VSRFYLYGLTRPRELPERLVQEGVSLLCADGRAAIVSPLGAGPVEATRHNLLAHADVVEELHATGPVRPARFGIALAHRDEVLQLLDLPEVERLLEAHRSTCELTLKGSYDEGVLREVAAGLAALREAYRRSPTLDNAVALGEAVTASLAERRRRDAALVLDRLEPLTLGVVADDPVGELDALDVSLLVERDRVDAVSSALDELATTLSPPLRFKLVGPLPPYSFVDLEPPVTA
jgi:hypothetical protein